MYAIVDIETTGSYAAANGITEISIQIFDGEKVIDRFDTLVNPVHHIPPYMQAMTGITNDMVAEAPLFEEIAETVYSFLKDQIFVAHNVHFDYSFLKSQLQYCGYIYEAPKLCTVRLSRKILPGYTSYSLGKLCDCLGITHINRHRAGGDTDATVTLFKMLLQHDADGHIPKSLKRNSKEYILPPNVPKTDFDKLPYTPGVYYFHDDKGKVVYVGKAKNIRYRVNSHFSNNSTGRQKQNFMRYVHHISYEECGTELMAAVKESSEIKKLWPRFNNAQKRREDMYGIISYEDQNGYLRVAVDKMYKGMEVYSSFHHIDAARAAIRQMVHDFSLCPRLCFLNEAQYDEKMHRVLCKKACEQNEPATDYNARVIKALEKLKQQPSFAILDKGISKDHQSCILVWQGRFYGMGFIQTDMQVEHPAYFKDLVTPYKENSTITHMLFDYARRYPAKILPLKI